MTPVQVRYKEAFLKDLKRLKKQPIYDQIVELAFTLLPQASSLHEISNVKALRGHHGRYLIRIGDYRIGLEVENDAAELMRVLHRREFYRYFP